MVVVVAIRELRWAERCEREKVGSGGIRKAKMQRRVKLGTKPREREKAWL